MELTRQERRALRAIEEALAAEDPMLAELLCGPAEPQRARRLRRLTWTVAVLAATLLGVGLLLSDAAWLFGGLLLLLTVPAIRWWASATAADGEE